MLRNTAPRRSAFTLVELVLSMTVASVLLGGIISTILLATRAVPNGEDAGHVVVASRDVVDRIAHELYTARSFIQRTANAVEFTVPDRNNDTAPETIFYAWSGTPGDPITRRYNGGIAVEIVEQAHEFQLDYQLRTVDTEGPPTEDESAETLLASYDSTEDLATFAVSASNWPAQYFLPSLPVDATAWKVTRIKFRARERSPNDGETLVQLRDGSPSGTVLQQVSMVEATLPADYLWQEFSFSNVSGLAPNEGLFLVLQHVSSNHSCEVQYQNTNVPLSDANFRATYDGGSNWLESIDKSLLFQVYGTVTTPGDPEVVIVYYLTGVRITMRAGSDAASRVQTGVQILNQPEVTG